MSIRVLIADDSLTVRKRIAEALEGKPEFQVVGEAVDGRQAVDLCLKLHPDVITLDLAMPVMSGLEATVALMARCPTPILIVSASINRGELFQTYQALAAGAVDVLDKTPGSLAAEWDGRLASALRVAARVKVVTQFGRPRAVFPPSAGPAMRAVGIGASTGGPAAVLELLKGLPRGFPVPILLVLHLATGFTAALADWLDKESPLRTAFVKGGEALPPPGQACVFLAPADHHLTLAGGHLALNRAAQRHSGRPSVDVLFESMALDLGAASAGCLLTGMGRDGAAGLLAMRQAGASTIAQDEASSVVYGMPGEAARLGAAGQILPLKDIAGALAALAHGVPR
jgi:two-component system chemotaxis response regulator CheB